MILALCTFNLTETVFDDGNVTYLMNRRFPAQVFLVTVIYSDLTVQRTKCRQEIPCGPQQAGAAVTAVFS